MVKNRDDTTTAMEVNPKSGDLEIIPASSLCFEHIIGEGGFGTVHQGYHKQWGKVAIKKLTTNFIDKRVTRRLVAEAEKLQHLSHPNTIQMLGLVIENTCYAIVFEFMQHGSLDVFIDTYNVSWAMKLELIEGIVLGMNYLHTRTAPIIHRDLKAQNILIGRDCNVKVCDFGLSEWRSYSENYTAHGTGLGTVTHVPPESWANLSLAPTRSYDMYSFAILIWEVCTQEMPFKGVRNSQIMEGVKTGQRPGLELVKEAEAPDVLTGIIQECWAQTPSCRPTFDHVKMRLEADGTRSSIDMAQARLQLLREISHSDTEAAASQNGGVQQALAPPSQTQLGPLSDQQSSTVPAPNSDELQMNINPRYPASADFAPGRHNPVNCKQQDLKPSANLGRDRVRNINPEYPASTNLSQVQHGGCNDIRVDSIRYNYEPEIDGVGSDLPVTNQQTPEQVARLPQAPATNLHIANNLASSAQPGVSSTSQPDSEHRLLRTNHGNQRGSLGRNANSARDSTISSASSLSRASTLPREAEPDAEPETHHSLSTPNESRPSTMESLSGTTTSTTSNRGGGPAPPRGPRTQTPKATPHQTHYRGSPSQEEIDNIFKNITSHMPEIPDIASMKLEPSIIHKTEGKGTTVIYQGAATRSNIQIGDHNVMYVNSATRSTSDAHIKGSPQRIKKDKITTSNRPLDFATMDLVSKHLGRYWKALGRRLGFSTGELDQINFDHKVEGLNEKIYQMLEKWRVKEGRDASVGVLAEKLWGIDQCNLAAALK